MAKHNKIGQIGEEISCLYLKKKRFRIIARNYRKKYGEIDIVARGTDDTLHFIEVKTVSYETKFELERAATRETWQPEEMLHTQKQNRFKRVIRAWLYEKQECGDWQIDLITVRVVSREKYAKVKFFEDLIFE